MQLTESEVYSTGLRMGDIVIYRKDIDNRNIVKRFGSIEFLVTFRIIFN